MIGGIYRKYKFKKEFNLENDFIFKMEGFSVFVSQKTFFNSLKNQNKNKNISEMFKELIHLYIKNNKLEKEILRLYSELSYKNIIFGTGYLSLPDDFENQLKIDEYVLIMIEKFQEKNQRFSQLMCHSIQAYLDGNLNSINDILQNGSLTMYSDFMKGYISMLSEEYKTIADNWNESFESTVLKYQYDLDYGINSEEHVLNYNYKKNYTDNFNQFFDVGNIIEMLEQKTSILIVEDKEINVKIGKYINHNSFKDIEIIIPDLYNYYTTIHFKKMKGNTPVFQLNVSNISNELSLEGINDEILKRIS